MHYNKIRKMDISNGPGIRVSIFMQVCTFNCKNCFNKETHDFNAGLEFDDNVIEKILDLSKSEHIKGLSILGGEPLHKKNILGTTKLAKEFRSKYPNKTIWVWTGNLYEDIKDYEIFNYIDVLVDGRYVDELHDFTLDYRGSSNQRVIEILKSRESDDIVLYSKDEVKC